MLQEAAESKREREILLQRLHANELVRIKEMTMMQVEEARETALSKVEAHRNLLAMEVKDIRAQKERIMLGAKKNMENIESERAEAAKAFKERSAAKLREELNILASKAAAERAVAENTAAAGADRQKPRHPPARTAHFTPTADTSSSISARTASAPFERHVEA